MYVPNGTIVLIISLLVALCISHLILLRIAVKNYRDEKKAASACFDYKVLTMSLYPDIARHIAEKLKPKGWEIEHTVNQGKERFIILKKRLSRREAKRLKEERKEIE